MLCLNIYLRRKPLKMGKLANNQMLSLVIPFRDEAANIPALLGDIAKLDYQHHLLEIIFVDDHSHDEGPALIHNFAAKYWEMNIRMIPAPENVEGKKQCLKMAIEEAAGSIILQTDADCRLKKDWVKVMSASFDSNTALVLGTVKMIPSSGFWSRFAALEFMSLQASGAAFIKAGRPVMGSAANMAFRKSLWEKYQFVGSGAMSGDDVFLIQAIGTDKDWKLKFISDEKTLVETAAPEDFRTFINQRARWGGKAPAYISTFAHMVAAVVVGMALSMAVFLLLSFFWLPAIPFFVALLLIKAVVDYPLLQKFASLTGQKKLLKGFFPATLIYPLYIFLTGMAILFRKANWKGRPVT